MPMLKLQFPSKKEDVALIDEGAGFLEALLLPPFGQPSQENTIYGITQVHWGSVA